MLACTALAYKPNVESILTRLRLFYSRAAGDRVFATMDVPNAAIERFARAQ